MPKTLAENKGGKITLVVVGSCINLAALLESGADDISELCDLELVNGQVDKVVLMGGCFADAGEIMAEYNIKTDIRSAKAVFEKCPVPIAVSHFDVGLRVMSGSRLMEEELKTGNPAAEAYRFHVGGKRHSWDPIAAFYAIYGCLGVFSDSRRGKITVDDDGVTRLCEGEGAHILIDCDNIERAEIMLGKAMLGEIDI
jgi:inosine-uridine nucleoside N-ribohydrolase